MIQIFEWLAMAMLSLFCLAVCLVLVFIVACIVVEGVKAIVKEVRKDDRTE